MRNKKNKLLYIEGKEDIEATGHITVGFDINLDKKFIEASPEDVAQEILRQITDGDFTEVAPINYRILGP